MMSYENSCIIPQRPISYYGDKLSTPFKDFLGDECVVTQAQKFYSGISYDPLIRKNVITTNIDVSAHYFDKINNRFITHQIIKRQILTKKVLSDE